ncbi:DUF397 domain-containing protein [Streptomyces sp. YGL11-2]|uniref:DUF397 domain-containing protein n=1 Tax=Streptomyces sp. YGL11-2 TaxID=3414028 RepID=UPI003CF12DA9
MTRHTIQNAASIGGWRKSSYSGSENGSCLEVLDGDPHAVPVRDSKAPRGPVVVVPAEAWVAFVAAVRGGGFAG